MKVAIVGGGVAGLAIGWRLAGDGCAVEVLERNLAGRASSWAAAGMLAATAETGIADDAHAQLAHAGLEAWPEFACAVEQASGQKIGYRRCGTLMIACSGKRAETLRALAAALQERGEEASWLTPEAAHECEPLLTPDMKGALYAPDDAQVDNRILGRALAAAFVRAGGVLREHCEVRALDVRSGRVHGVETAEGTVEADRVIIAAGAWSGQIAGADGLAAVRPAKGQMTALAQPAGAQMPRHLIWGEDIVYLVPREGTLLIGATVEDSGFETSVSLAVREMLIERAVRLVPSLSSWQVSESWAGLRPRTPDDNPVLGATKIEGLYAASGQYRNGILFAPVIAETMRRLILGAEPDAFQRAFDPARFTSA